MDYIHLSAIHVREYLHGVLALGRKNWIFCGNDASAYRAAIVYSLISSCQSVGVDPREWMEDALCKLPYYNRDKRDIAELLPREWAELW